MEPYRREKLPGRNAKCLAAAARRPSGVVWTSSKPLLPCRHTSASKSWSPRFSPILQILSEPDMRIPKSLSYSSMSLWYKDQDEFYVRYLADHAAPRQPQEQPAAVGSAFDAYVKAQLNWHLYGRAMSPHFDFRPLREPGGAAQSDVALNAGKSFQGNSSAVLRRSLEQLQQSVEPPRFEFKVDGRRRRSFPGSLIAASSWTLGRPHPVHYDWKVRPIAPSTEQPVEGICVCLTGS